jgi:hypothetical protein
MSCNDDHDCPVIPIIPEPEETVEMIELNEPFLAKLGGIYFLVDNGDTLEIHLSAIIDMRDYGYDCVLSQGGYAEIGTVTYLNGNRYIYKLIRSGCDGDNEYDISNPGLPNYQVTDYTIKMMKMYPLSSEVHDYIPENLDEYEIKLVVIK